MKRERWRQVEQIHHSALEREEGQRASFLKEACAGDEELRREVESLLAHKEQAESFIEVPALEAAAKGLAEGQPKSLVGRQIGSYQILSLLGAGGMGEVYRAEDTRLGRPVAVKVLPEELAQDKERLHRFVREARAASALNHANVAHIYEIGQSDGLHFIAMEYVEGQSLAQKMSGQPLELKEVLDIGIQAADALEEAHRKGITHRDIKPANLMITPKGQVKVLDFGLAKITRPEGEAAGSDVSTSIHTAEGVVMGTLRYMSPEQVLGKKLDARTDLFSLGVVLYEMTTGRLPFSGSNASEVTDQILHAQPEAIARFNYNVPAELERIVRKCLEKDRERRYQSAGDIAFDLEALIGPSSVAEYPTLGTGRLKRRDFFAWTAAAILFLVAVAFAVAYFRPAPTDAPVLKLSVLPPEKASLGSSCISPDGRHLALVATAEGKTLLWVRRLDSLTARALPGTEGANYPFWSPDSRFIGFFTEDKLKKIEAAGGPAQTLANVTGGGRGGTWNRSEVIVFAPNYLDALYRISAKGGDATPVTTLDHSRQENSHRWPHFLPDSHHFLYFVRSSQRENQGIYVGSFDSKDKRLLVSASGSAAYVPPGYLLFVRDGTLMAERFDANRLQITGDSFSVADQVGYTLNMGSDFSASDTGVLTYRHGGSSQLVWFDRGEDRSSQ